MVAERQHGVVAARQLIALGYSRSSIARDAAVGRLHRLHRGVYAVGHRVVSWEGRCLAAVLACGPDALASHGSAAWLWGLLSSRPGAIHVSVEARRSRKSAIHLHFARLPQDDRAIQDGIPVTALPRTLLDLAASLQFGRLEKAVENAERLRLLDLRSVESLLERSVGHPGTGRLRRALSLYREETAYTRSELERRFLDLVRRSGLPRPSTNVFVGGYELDAYWPRERFAVELDGYEYHGTRAAFERDSRRQEELKLAGIEMIRVTSRRIDSEPKELLGRIGVLLERRRRGGGS